MTCTAFSYYATLVFVLMFVSKTMLEVYAECVKDIGTCQPHPCGLILPYCNHKNGFYICCRTQLEAALTLF